MFRHKKEPKFSVIIHPADWGRFGRKDQRFIRRAIKSRGGRLVHTRYLQEGGMLVLGPQPEILFTPSLPEMPSFPSSHRPDMPLDVIDARTRAARAYVGDWIVCPTCDGEACPDCVDGYQPSPELIERGAKALLERDAPDMVLGSDDTVWHDMAKAVLLASQQGDTPP